MERVTWREEDASLSGTSCLGVGLGLGLRLGCGLGLFFCFGDRGWVWVWVCAVSWVCVWFGFVPYPFVPYLTRNCAASYARGVSNRMGAELGPGGGGEEEAGADEDDEYEVCATSLWFVRSRLQFSGIGFEVFLRYCQSHTVPSCSMHRSIASSGCDPDEARMMSTRLRRGLSLCKSLSSVAA